MSLLSYTELRGLQADGIIEHSLPSHVNSASIDITLGTEVLLEELPTEDEAVIDLRARQPLPMRRFTMGEEGLLLPPNSFILAHSVQIFHLPNWLSCEYKLKSSLARIGLEHMNAGWADAGWHGSALTLEFKNVTQHHVIRIRPGDAIGQVVFFRHAPVPAERSYAARGRYNNDRTVQGIKE
jgi:dCTP deaminase